MSGALVSGPAAADGAGAAVLAQLERWIGLDLERGGQGETTLRFVAARARALGLPSAQAYVERLADPAGAEEQRLIAAVTINHTWFFRDPQQLEHIGALLRQRFPRDRRVHIWVAGCASGEDAYSLALVGEREGRDLWVLGSDIHKGALDCAARGRYSAAALCALPPALQGRFGCVQGDDGMLEVAPALRRSVRFQLHNLVAPPLRPPSGGWDIILCRNVLIYFQPARAQAVMAQLARTLGEGGVLLLGACEVLRAVPEGLRVADLGARYALERPPASEPPPMELDAPAARAQARLNAGVSLYAADDIEAAVPALREAQALDPTLWPASLYLALSYERQGRQGDALREFQRAVEGGGAGAGLPADLAPWRDEMLALASARVRAAGAPAPPPRRTLQLKGDSR